MRSVNPIGLVALAGLLCGSCTPDFATQDESNVILRITDIGGLPGSEDLDPGDILYSDTCCIIINDDARLTFQAILKNQNLSVINPVSNNNNVEDVFLERYEVVYLRSDGRNTEGVDVPYRISGPMAVMVPADDGARTTADITVVRHQAKLEPPLRNLKGVFLQLNGVSAAPGTIQFGGAGILTTIAEITVHGRTTSGHAVRAMGRLQITFADFGGEG